MHEDKLHGIGRKMWVCQYGEGSVTEGQFKNGMLEGFGRYIKVSTRIYQNDALTGGMMYEVGYWKSGVLHGYGKRYSH